MLEIKSETASDIMRGDSDSSQHWKQCIAQLANNYAQHN